MHAAHRCFLPGRATECRLALCVIDREEGAKEHLATFNVELRSLFRISELLVKES